MQDRPYHEGFFMMYHVRASRPMRQISSITLTAAARLISLQWRRGLEAAMAYGLQLQADGSGEVTVSGLARKDSSGKLSRVTCLTDEQKELIRKMNDASELDVKERRMYYRALDRRMQDKDLPVGVLSKFHAAAGSHKKKQLGYVPGDGLYMYILYICI